jgi:hypothetical protein
MIGAEVAPSSMKSTELIRGKMIWGRVFKAFSQSKQRALELLGRHVGDQGDRCHSSTKPYGIEPNPWCAGAAGRRARIEAPQYLVAAISCVSESKASVNSSRTLSLIARYSQPKTSHRLLRLTPLIDARSFSKFEADFDDGLRPICSRNAANVLTLGLRWLSRTTAESLQTADIKLALPLV